MAKDLVRTRRYVKKFILMRANIQAVSLKIQVRVHFLIILWWERWQNGFGAFKMI